MRKIETVCIVGSGYLGTQIGALCARHGFKTNLFDISDEMIESSKEAVDGYLREWIEEGVVNETKPIKDRLTYYTELEDAAGDADYVIEAVTEQLSIKRQVFSRLNMICQPDVVIATNSSSIRVSKIETATLNPQRVVNMHFYGYPWRNRIVELMRGTHTTDETMETARTFSKSIGINPLMVLKESTGFIFNRIWRAIKKESLRVADERVASFEDVDRAWMSLYGLQAGPFGLMDRVGLDVVRDIEMVYYEESGDLRDKPPKILLDKIEKGELGVKTGKGFYSYPNPRYMDPDWLRGE